MERKTMESDVKIILPRDAEGREIPLDTKVLYSLSGDGHEVDEFIYSPSENIWRVALIKQFVHFYTCDFHLAPVVVLCADGKPVSVGDTVYCDDSPEPLTVKGFAVNECGPVDVKSADGAYYTVSAGRLTHERPDSWEKLLDDLARCAIENDEFNSTACAYMNRGGGMCGGCKFCDDCTRRCSNQMFEDIASRIRMLRGEAE